MCKICDRFKQKSFHVNELFPYLIITPTLPKEDLAPEELLSERKKLLQSATKNEMQRFEDWKIGHERFREVCPDDEILHEDVHRRIGFTVAKDEMRNIMLMDTAQRLPEVLRSLREDLTECQNELDKLHEKKRLMDPKEVKLMVGVALHEICKRISDYLDGDLETASKFPESLKDLDEELEDEEDSEWKSRRLGESATIEEEEQWRDQIESLVDEDMIPDYVNAKKKFLGGKQFQRAFQLMKVVMAGKFAIEYLCFHFDIFKKQNRRHSQWILRDDA
jgi:hypothetical protein